MNPAPPVMRMCMEVLPLVRTVPPKLRVAKCDGLPTMTQGACQTGQTAGKDFRSDGSVVLALPRAVPIADPADVRVHVVGQLEHRPNADDPVRIMEVRGYYRHVGGFRDFPEARLPALDRFARALRRQAEPELPSLGNE